MGLREQLREKPWIGWILAAVLATGATLAFVRAFSGGADRRDELAEEITIRCSETGAEWTMNRGMLELELMTKSNKGPLNAAVGLTNPDTGEPTGFPVSSEWQRMIERINEQRAAAAAARGEQWPPPGSGESGS